MVSTKKKKKKKYDCKIIICPTLREPDGLAMSSRNLRLNPEQRKLAVHIYETMLMVKIELSKSEIGHIKQKAVNKLSNAGFRVDYVEISAASSLKPIITWDGHEKVVVLVAAYLDDIRLIDNMVLEK